MMDVAVILNPRAGRGAHESLEREIVELFATHGVSLLETLCRMLPMAYRDLPKQRPEVPCETRSHIS